MGEVVVGLDVHLKNTQVTVMKMNGEIVKKERIRTCKAELRKSLESVPKGTKVALESVGFCWPWIDFLAELRLEPLLANPLKVKLRAEDVKNDKVDSKTLAELTRMNWLPTCYVPPAELRWLRSMLRIVLSGRGLAQESRTGPNPSLGSAISTWRLTLARRKEGKQLLEWMFLRFLRTSSFLS